MVNMAGGRATITGESRRATEALQLAPDIFCVGRGEEARLVDLLRGRFYAVGAVGARMIRIAVTHGENLVASTIAREYGVPLQTASQDWTDLQQTLRAAGLLQPKRPGIGWPPGLVAKTVRNRRASSRAMPSKLYVSLLTIVCWFSLRLLGWARTVRALRALHPQPATSPGRVLQGVDEVDEAVRQAATGLILNSECKERAIVAWHILRGRFGLPATLLVGIKRYPFQAHAWVEIEGRYISDHQERCQEFSVVARYK